MLDTVYAVFTEGHDYYSRPMLNQLFYNKTDADAYADKLKNEEEEGWGGVNIRKVYFNVWVEECEIK